MNIARLPDQQVPNSSVTQAAGAAETRSGAASGKALPRVRPPFAFEVEEFHSQIPDDDWRHWHGVPQTLDFPSIGN